MRSDDLKYFFKMLSVVASSVAIAYAIFVVVPMYILQRMGYI